MDLALYLYRNSISVREFAKELDMQPTYISRVKLKRVKPGRKCAQAIVNLTNGIVTMEDLYAPAEEITKVTLTTKLVEKKVYT